MVKIADFIEAPNSGGDYPKVLLVAHLTISPEVTGAARGVVRYWQDKRTGSTAYVVDAKEIIQAVRETAYSWSAGTTANRWGIHVEHCGFLQTLRQWRDEYSSAELELSAELFAYLSDKYDIPLRWLTIEQIRHAVKTGDPRDGGMCTHDDIRQAFPGETFHTDPGKFFPKANFLKMAQKAKADRKPEPAPKPEPKPVATVNFEAVTHNIRHALSAADVRATLDRLTASPADVIALQEMSGRRPLLEGIDGWEDVLVDVPDVKGEAANPLLVRTSVFEVRREEVVQVTDRATVPARAAGPSNLGAYWFTHAPLLHKETGRTVHAISVHMPASHQIAEMRALADTAAKRLAAYIAGLKGQVIVLGDWNTEKPLDLGDGALRKAGFKSNHDVLGELVTHTERGKRAIDAALIRGDRMEFESHRTLKWLPSDHLPLLVRLSLTVKEKK